MDESSECEDDELEDSDDQMSDREDLSVEANDMMTLDQFQDGVLREALIRKRHTFVEESQKRGHLETGNF